MTNFVQLLPKSLSPDNFRGGKPLTRDNNDEFLQWIYRFWKFIDFIDGDVDKLYAWCLLPVIWKAKSMMFPLEWCKYTIYHHGFQENLDLDPIIKTLPIPFSEIISRKLYSLQAKYDDRATTLNCLHFWRRHIENDVLLTSEECLTLLRYLIQDIKKKEHDKIQKLKDLTLFPSMNGCITSITNKKVITFDNACNIALPTEGLNDLFSFLGIFVLEDFPEMYLSRMYELLGCKRMDSGMLYANYILPNLDKIAQTHRLAHLSFVNDHLRFNSSVTSVLPSVNLVQQGNLFLKGNDFYDPENSFFVLMCKSSEFPPHPFNEPCWRKFLLYAGMNVEVSEKILFRFAQEISSTSCQDYKKPRSSRLVAELLKYLRQKPVSSDFLNAISHLPFIVIDNNQQYERIHPSHKFGLKFIAYNNSVSHKYFNISWTTAEVVPEYAMPLDENMESRLNIVKPSRLIVETHIKKICSNLSRTCAEHDDKFLDEIMRSIYEYLIKTSFEIVTLINVPIIYISKYKLFVKASRLVINLSDKDEIVPYLLKIPLEYGVYAKLFKNFGMQIDITTNTYCRVLKEIKEHTIMRPFTPDELDVIQRALKGLLKSLQESEAPLDNLDEDILYLLSENNTLESSEKLYYECLDIPRHQLKRVEGVIFIADFACIGFNVTQLHDLFNRLPSKNRPKSIRFVVIEKLCPCEFTESATASSLHECLTSDNFITTVLRFIKTDQMFFNNDFNISEMKLISAKLRRLRIRAVNNLQTRLFYCNAEHDCTIIEKICFYDESVEIIYINDKKLELEKWLQKYDVELERIIRVICGDKLIDGSLLKILSQINVDSKSVQERLTKIGLAFIEDRLLGQIWFPLPGSLVPVELHSYIRKPSKPLSVKEYAVISTLGSSCQYSNANDEERTLVYVIVTDFKFENQCYELNDGTLSGRTVSAEKVFYIKIADDEEEVPSESHQSHHTPSYSSPSFDHVDSRNTTSSARGFYQSEKANPQYPFACKWLHQAMCDLTAGNIMLTGLDNEQFQGYNWVCMQSQQAAEKAIKAARHATDANKFMTSHDLSDNIPESDSSLQNLAYDLEDVVGHINSLRYPDVHSTPAERYSRENAMKSLRLAKLIFKHVSVKYFRSMYL